MVDWAFCPLNKTEIIVGKMILIPVFLNKGLNVNCRKNLSGSSNYLLAQPLPAQIYFLPFTFGLLFTFRCNSLAHDPDLIYSQQQMIKNFNMSLLFRNSYLCVSMNPINLVIFFFNFAGLLYSKSLWLPSSLMLCKYEEPKNRKTIEVQVLIKRYKEISSNANLKRIS